MITKHSMINQIAKKEATFRAKAKKASSGFFAQEFNRAADEYAYWKNQIKSMSTIKFYTTVIRFGVNQEF